MNWTKSNVETTKKKLQASEQSYNDYNAIVNDNKRLYQSSVFAVQ